MVIGASEIKDQPKKLSNGAMRIHISIQEKTDEGSDNNEGVWSFTSRKVMLSSFHL